jgi:hypothetical protein
MQGQAGAPVVALDGSAAKAVVNATRLIAPMVMERRRRKALELQSSVRATAIAARATGSREARNEGTS